MNDSKQTIRIWVIVALLNFIAITGAIYLNSIGVNLYAFKGGTQ